MAIRCHIRMKNLSHRSRTQMEIQLNIFKSIADMGHVRSKKPVIFYIIDRTGYLSDVFFFFVHVTGHHVLLVQRIVHRECIIVRTYL